MIVTSEIKSKRLLALLERVGAIAVSREGLDESRCEVSLILVSAEEMRELNARYRGKNEPTDVLSFPMFENIVTPGSGEAPVILGDVAICREIAEKQAAEIGQSAEKEIVYLFVHSMLHLLGYNHENEDDKGKMREAEEEILKELGEIN